MLTLDLLDAASTDQLVDERGQDRAAARAQDATGRALLESGRSAEARDQLTAAVEVGDLLALLDSYQPGHLAPMLRAERDLARARLVAADGDPAAREDFAAAVAGVRERSTPYHLAHGLLDHAEYLARLGDADAAAVAVDEARVIADRLRCQPLLDRADAVTPAGPG